MTTEIIATQGFGAAKRLDDGRYRIIVSGEAEADLAMRAPELMAENEKLKNRLKATQFLLDEARDKLGREVQITDKNAIYVDDTRITHRGTKWGVHNIVESFIVHDRVEVYQRAVDAGYERAARNIDTPGFGGGDFLPKMEDE